MLSSTIVISDAHFGTSFASLSHHVHVDYLIWELWKYGQGCDEVVLLGDFFDLWRARPEVAIKDAGYFLERLSELDLAVRYVIGNHDHHLMVMWQELQLLERVARGDIFSVYTPNLHWRQSFDGLEMDMYYPTYVRGYGGRKVVFTHGHHLDGVQSFSLQLMEGLRRLSGDEISPADLEMMMTYAYESIYRSSYIGEMVELEERLWKVSTILDRIKSSFLRTFRFTSAQGQMPAILKFLDERDLLGIRAFIYGDTHKAEMLRPHPNLAVVNAGCLNSEGNRDGLEVSNNTYLVIDEDALTLRQLGQRESLGQMMI